MTRQEMQRAGFEKMYGTATGRMSSSPAIQNIPLRTEEGKRMKDALSGTKAETIIADEYVVPEDTVGDLAADADKYGPNDFAHKREGFVKLAFVAPMNERAKHLDPGMYAAVVTKVEFKDNRYRIVLHAALKPFGEVQDNQKPKEKKEQDIPRQPCINGDCSNADMHKVPDGCVVRIG